MRYRYPFQKLLDLKTNEKEQAEWNLSDAIGQLQQEQLSLSALTEERSRVAEQLGLASARMTTISEIQLLELYLQRLDRQMHSKAKDVEKAKANVADKRQALSGKMMEEKVWTKAKEKAQIQFTATLLKKEQEELDEIALTRRIQTIMN